MRRVCCSFVLLGAWLWASPLALAASGHSGRTALVAGKVLLCGHGGSGPTRCSPPDRAIVSVFNAQHQRVARARATNGHFRFRLLPGRYELRARWAGASIRRTVAAKAYCTVHTKLRFALHG
jgi:hypothetical protein